MHTASTPLSAPTMLRLARTVARRAIVPLVAARPLSVAAVPTRVWGVAAATPVARPAAALASSWRTCATASEEAAPRAREERDTSTQLFVGNLPFTTDAQRLGSLFTDYGVVDTKVIYDQQTGRSKGIAFVTFGSADDANKAQAALNGAVRGTPRVGAPPEATGTDTLLPPSHRAQELDGRSIRVESRTPPGERKPYTPREPRPAGMRRPQQVRHPSAGKSITLDHTDTRRGTRPERRAQAVRRQPRVGGGRSGPGGHLQGVRNCGVCTGASPFVAASPLIPSLTASLTPLRPPRVATVAGCD